MLGPKADNLLALLTVFVTYRIGLLLARIGWRRMLRRASYGAFWAQQSIGGGV